MDGPSARAGDFALKVVAFQLELMEFVLNMMAAVSQELLAEARGYDELHHITMNAYGMRLAKVLHTPWS